MVNGYPEHVIKSFMAMKMKQFHVLPKFGPEKCPVYLRLPWLGSVSTRLKSKLNLLWNSAFPLWNHVVFTLPTSFSRYQQGCTACFTEKQRDLSFLMPLWQSVCRPYFPKAAGQNQTTCHQIYPFLLFFPKTLTACSAVQIFHPD